MEKTLRSTMKRVKAKVKETAKAKVRVRARVGATVPVEKVKVRIKVKGKVRRNDCRDCMVVDVTREFRQYAVELRDGVKTVMYSLSRSNTSGDVLVLPVDTCLNKRGSPTSCC